MNEEKFDKHELAIFLEGLEMQQVNFWYFEFSFFVSRISD